jgi:hypothetical protein
MSAASAMLLPPLRPRAAHVVKLGPIGMENISQHAARYFYKLLP